MHPEFDDAGLPKAIPVTPVGSQDDTGRYHPIYSVSSSPPQDNGFPWEKTLQIALGVLGVGGLGGAGVAMRFASRAKTALGIACRLADDNAVAETDDQVRLAKSLAEARQIREGVHAMTQKARKNTK